MNRRFMLVILLGALAACSQSTSPAKSSPAPASVWASRGIQLKPAYSHYTPTTTSEPSESQPPCIRNVMGLYAAVSFPDTPPAQIKETGTNATIFELDIRGAPTLAWRKWLEKTNADHKAEIVIVSDGRRAAMSFDEFRRRVFAGEP